MRSRPSIALIARLAAVPPEPQFTCSIILGELIHGAHRLTERAGTLLQKIDDILTPDLTVLPFDARAARHYGVVRVRLEKLGTVIGDADLRIASIAFAHDLTVVTGNVRHFQRIPSLMVENWLE